MSVHSLNDTEYQVLCDGKGKGLGCANKHVFGKTQPEIKQAEDFLERHGWRTIERLKHYCQFCAAKEEAFKPTRSVAKYKVDKVVG